MTFGIVLGVDSVLSGQGLAALLDGQTDLRLLDQAANGQDVLRLVDAEQPDLLLLAAKLPGLNALEVAARVARIRGPRVIVFGADANRDFVLRALEAGVDGLLLRESPFDEMLAAIRMVRKDQRYLSPRIADLVVDQALGHKSPRIGTALGILTPREREVLQLIAEGHSTKGIAARLGISVKTVEWHRQQIMRKLGVHSIAGLTRFALREGLVSLED